MLPRLPDDLHLKLGTSFEVLEAVVEGAVHSLSPRRYYVFLSPPGTNSGANAPARPRTIPAFVSPDDAVTFAQRNGAGSKVRVRGIDAGDLIRHMLANPSIGTVLFLQSLASDIEPRQFPPGLKVSRDSLLDHIRNHERA